MRYFIYNLILVFTLVGFGCSSSENVTSDLPESSSEQAEESISLNINEVVYFEFEKTDDQWVGELTIYTLNEEEEKVVQSEYISANDSTWLEFGEFIDFLNLYEIGPQNELENWIPDSSQLPQRVFSFRVFDGDTTRSFTYQDPGRYIQKYWEVHNILTFTTYIQYELSWVEVDDL